jgi:ubiquinone/menaquinone biosynthesis C-methylase UbiE
MANSDQFDYVLRGGSQGAERLRLLAAVKWPTTKTLLERAGLRQGMSCLDVGCGIGAVAICMVEWVGPKGSVVGMDIDERCVQLARLEAQQLGWNVDFRVGSATDLKETADYNLVFGRFVLTHLHEPERALQRMVAVARPGGVVVVEDIQFTGHFGYPACPAFDRYVTLYQEVVQKKGGDPNIGPRLPGMFLDAGLAEIDMEVIQPTYRQGPGKQIAAVTMEHIREAVVGAGLASNEEVDRIVAELGSFAGNPRTMMSLPRIFQVWGKRPP